MDQAASVPAYTLRRSRRRRRTIELSLHPGGGLLVAAPVRTPRCEIDDFVRRRARWIAKARRDALDRKRLLRRSFAGSERFLFLGRPLTLRVTEGGLTAGCTVEQVESFLEVTLAAGTCAGERAATVRTAVEAWYQARAETVFADRVRCYAPPAGVSASRVIVKAQKTRWGSCGRDGTLRFNRRLVMAPLAVLDYVVVHELCHLRQAGHGRRFWQLVRRVLPGYEAARAGLRRNGWRYTIG